MARLEMRRIILFTADVATLARWYERVFGLRVHELEEGWAELDAGGCRLALHRAPKRATKGKRVDCGHKIVFAAKDVAKARASLLARGAKLGPVRRFGALHLCDGRDPAGNAIQISNRP